MGTDGAAGNPELVEVRAKADRLAEAIAEYDARPRTDPSRQVRFRAVVDADGHRRVKLIRPD